jgi:hypothetical protein
MTPPRTPWNVIDQFFLTAIATQFLRALAKPNVRGAGFDTAAPTFDVTDIWRERRGSEFGTR